MPSGVQTCADRKSTRLNSSHGSISYAVFCLKKKKQPVRRRRDPCDTTDRKSCRPPGHNEPTYQRRPDHPRTPASECVARGELFFFFNDAGPPEIPPFPPPGPLPI